MSVLIKGMEMPKNCGECQFCHTENFTTYCCPTGREDIFYDAIPEWCPLEEPKTGEWIPCSERLPEEQGQYYVSGGNKVWICDFLIFSNLKGGWCNNVSNPVVEAWMPLPEPYKGEEEKK